MSALGLFLKNISSLADDMTSLVKISTKNTLTVVGDDIVASSENFSELKNSRELPVILQVAKGAIINKLILVPIILGLSYFFSWLIPYILLLASFYLAYEGYESFFEVFFQKNKEKKEQLNEKIQIKESIKIDFILSLEIILITLASVENEPFLKQSVVVTIVSLLMVFVIYGTVLFIVKIDDIGFFIYKKGLKFENKILISLGKKLIKLMAYILKILPYIGLYAVLFVSGEIFIDNYIKIMSTKSMIWLHDKFLFEIIGYPIIAFLIGCLLNSLILRIKK